MNLNSPKMVVSRFGVFACIAAAILCSGATAEACSVCFADPDSSQGQALNAAVWTLMGSTFTVLAGAAALIGTVALRARRHAAADMDPEEEHHA